MARNLSTKLRQLDEQFSGLMFLPYQNDLCKMVIPWREDFKTFLEVINDKKNKKRLKDEKGQEWLEIVKKCADDVRKILDEIAITGKSSQKPRLFAWCRNSIADTAFTDTSRIGKTSMKIETLKNAISAIELQVSYNDMTSSGPELCKSAGLPNSGSIYGRDITDDNDHGNFSIMPVIGMAGIGKTSLARLVYDDEAVVDFKPEDSNVSRISKAILESTTSKSCHLKDVNDLAATILAGLLCALNGEMNGKANVMGDPECFKEDMIGGGNTKLNWSKEICVF